MDISTLGLILGIVSAVASIIFGTYRMLLDYRAEKRQRVAELKQEEKYRLIVPEQAKKQKSQKRKRRFVSILIYISLTLFLASVGLFVYSQTFQSHLSSLPPSTGYSSTIKAIALSPKRDLIASGFDDGMLNIYDVSKEHSYNIFQIPRSSDNLTISIKQLGSWSPIGDLIAFGSSDSKVRILDFNKRELIYTYTGHTMPVNCVSWSPKGDLIASGGDDNTVQIWQPFIKQTHY